MEDMWEMNRDQETSDPKLSVDIYWKLVLTDL